ncbi:MAG TPA: glycosyltransferase family 2 protein [Acidobacteriota bacterium]|jgi:glycosyltransferase involved in cell wall biosynthesis
MALLRQELRSASLSVCIITLNEADNLPRCLASLSGLASQVVVVDSFSSDQTQEIAKQASAELWEEEFLGYVRQKQYALEKATGDWVLCLDADEWLDADLRRAIAEVLAGQRGERVDGYQVNRQTFYLGDWMPLSRWSPEWRLRLVRRNRAYWTGVDPHDRLETTGPSGRLHGRLYHFPYRSVSHHVAKVNHYTDIQSKNRLASGSAPSPVNLMFAMALEPLWGFLRTYILSLGFLGGARGFIASSMAAFYIFLKHAKTWAAVYGKQLP